MEACGLGTTAGVARLHLDPKGDDLALQRFQLRSHQILHGLLDRLVDVCRHHLRIAAGRRQRQRYSLPAGRRGHSLHRHLPDR